MASMQCCKPANETCQTKCYHNSFGHKVSEMAGYVFKGNQQGQNYGHQTDHTINKTQCCGQNQTYSPNHIMAKPQTPCTSQSHGHHTMGHTHSQAHQATGHTQTHGHSHHSGHDESHGKVCQGKSGMKLRKKSECKNKENSMCSKRRDGNRSCSDSSGSDSD
ncbi:hypothetical protein O6P43_024027 [Quillaja saponaria]|uniref:Uncharacterized protein n=1 Tax=Quillaja saponaria TaxID=32244 RepID=A0AAD7L5U7_QUISA|nr:hypothetical protein O6P43_024027 [Quillaja saponaria]